MTTTATFRQFRGNPYIACTAITMGTIASSRTSCTGVPAIFHLSASAVTCTGTGDGTGDINPFEDIEHSWEVTTGAEIGDHTFACPWLVKLYAGTPQSTTYDSHTDQVGPEAVFRFFLPGTKTVTLTSRAADGAGGYITQTQTINLTVTANPNTEHYWQDPDSGNNTNDGRDPWGFAVTTGTLSGANVAVGLYEIISKDSDDQITIRIASGDDRTLTKTGAFAAYDHAAATAPDEIARYNYIYLTAGTAAGGISSSTGPKLSSGWSYGSNKTFHIKAETTNPWTAPTGSSRSRTAMRFVPYGVGLWNRNGGVMFSNTADGQTTTDISFHKCRSNGGTSGIQHSSSGTTESPVDHCYYSECEIDGATSNGLNLVGGGTEASVGIGTWGCVFDQPAGTEMGIYVRMASWFSCVGGSFTGTGNNATLDHHIYPHLQYHGCYKWIDFGASTLRNYCINTNWGGAEGFYAEYHLISECNITGTLRAWDASNGSNDYSVSRFRNFVSEGNAVHELTGDAQVLFYCCESMTVRDNIFWGNTGGRSVVPNSTQTALVFKFYKNRFWSDMASTSRLVEIFDAHTAVLHRDNDYFDDRSAASAVFNVPFELSGYQNLGNRVYTPNRTGNTLENDSVATTYAAYAAVDLLARDTTPDWTTPASGDFTPTYTPAGAPTVITQTEPVGPSQSTEVELGWTETSANANILNFIRHGPSTGVYSTMVENIANPVTLTGLTPNTTRFFRIYETDGYDIGESSEGYWTTGGGSPATDGDRIYGTTGINVDFAGQQAWTNPGNVNGDAPDDSTYAQNALTAAGSDFIATAIPATDFDGSLVGIKIGFRASASVGPAASSVATVAIYNSSGTVIASGGATLTGGSATDYEDTSISLLSGTYAQLKAIIVAGLPTTGSVGDSPRGLVIEAGVPAGSTTFRIHEVWIVPVIAEASASGFSSNKKVAASMLLLPSRRR